MTFLELSIGRTSRIVILCASATLIREDGRWRSSISLLWGWSKLTWHWGNMQDIAEHRV